MGEEFRRLSRRRKNRDKMNRILDHPEDELVIHYSCESFYDRDHSRTPRVTSIAVRNLYSGQTDSFSIHQIAEQKGISFEKIHDHYDALEKKMLESYFQVANKNQGKTWIHWNMRDSKYGFAALEHRLKVLGETPFVLLEDKKFDLARAMFSLYGESYIGHPRLEKLVEKNNITNRDMLTGAQEAEAFEAKNYVQLHQSTLRKVDIIANIFERAADGTIKTNARWGDVHGFHPAVVMEVFKEHWVYSILVLGVTIATILRLMGVI